jgi:cobalamin biosynthesis protein CobD/CbiB
MLDPKPRRMIGVPRAPRLSKPAWQWGGAEMVVGCLLWLVLVVIEIAAVLAVVYLAIEYALPWIVDVVMDAVEQRE